MAMRILLGAVAVLYLGWSPIVIYAAFGPPNGNPIGLGILAWMSTPVALVLLIMSAVIAFLRDRDRTGARA